MNPKLVHLKWLDSHSPNVSGWVSEHELHHGLHIINSVGWVIYEDKESITIASQLTGEDSDDISGVVSIPKCCILKTKGL